MLLPGGPPYPLRYLLALDSSARVAGAAAFAQAPASIHSVRIRVIRTERRRGIGRKLLHAIENHGPRNGPADIVARAEAHAEPDAEPFLTACGFTRTQRLTVAEADAALFRKELARLRRSVENRIPASARIVVPAPERLRELSEIFERLIVHDPETAARLRFALAAGRLDHSVVLEVDGRTGGMLLQELAGDTIVVYARAVEPVFRRGWANILLMSAALENGWEAGGRKIRLDWLEDNRDTQKLAARLGASPVRVLDLYRKEIGAALSAV